MICLDWQRLAISFLPLDKVMLDKWNDFILCFEMTIFAVIHLYSFPWYILNIYLYYIYVQIYILYIQCIYNNISIYRWEFRSGIQSTNSLFLTNVKHALSFKDVVSDVYHNIMPAYQTYVIENQTENENDIESDDNSSNNNNGSNSKLKTKKKRKRFKIFKTRTFMIGNLDNPTIKRNNHSKLELIPNDSMNTSNNNINISNNDISMETININEYEHANSNQNNNINSITINNNNDGI